VWSSRSERPAAGPKVDPIRTAPLSYPLVRYCRSLCIWSQQQTLASPDLNRAPFGSYLASVGIDSTEVAMLRLYDSLLSGNSWKVRILLSKLHLGYERVTLDLAKGDTHRPDFRELSRFSRIRALTIEEIIENRDRFSLRPHLPSRSPSRARSARLFSNQIDHSAQPGGHMLTSGIIERQAWKRRCPFF
jgi:hypothetical protein